MKKRLFFTVFLVFTLFLPLSAQVRMGNFSQQGPASQEMTDDGLVAAHPSLPLKTSVKVRNTSNNKEVNVTITNRVGVSSARIIDLSPAAYKALDLKKGDIVSLSVNPPPEAPAPPRVAAAKEPTPQQKAEAAPEPAPVQQAAPSAQAAPQQQPAGTVVTSGQLPGINVVVTNSTPMYSGGGGQSAPQDRIIIVNPPAPAPVPAPAPSSQSNAAYLAWMMAMTMEARDSRAAREDREVREAREAREARAARLAREEREEREYREAREAREARLAREEREAREARYAREFGEQRDARVPPSRDNYSSPAVVEEDYGYLETREMLWY